jgi:hypothetical protein
VGLEFHTYLVGASPENKQNIKWNFRSIYLANRIFYQNFFVLTEEILLKKI